MRRVFAVLFVVTGVVAALMFGGVAASAQDTSAAPTADLFTPTPAPVPMKTAATQPDARLAVVGPDPADFWNRAGTERQATLPAGTLLTAVGRSADEQWLYVYQVDGSEPALGAIHGSNVIVVDAASLPVLAQDAVPVILPIPTAHVNLQAAPMPGTAVVSPATTTAITEAAPITAEVNAGSVQLNVRSGPNTLYPVVAKLATGTVLSVLGRNDTSDWVEVTTAGSAGGTGWVSSAYVRLSQSAGSLPVVTRSNPPVPNQTPIVAPFVITSTSRHR